MLDPVLLTIVATLGRIIAEIVRGEMTKAVAFRELASTADLLRESLTTDAIARGEMAADMAEELKLASK